MKKTVVINGVEYVEESNFSKLLCLACGIGFAVLPICLIIGCILPTILP